MELSFALKALKGLPMRSASERIVSKMIELVNDVEGGIKGKASRSSKVRSQRLVV